MFGQKWRYDAGQSAEIDQDVDGADARRRGKEAPSVPGLARHHRKRHDAKAPAVMA